jgi:outer membrane lipoprotein-sorting protein
VKIFVLSLVALLLLPVVAMAETAEQKGLAIAVEADLRDNGFGDYSSTMSMVLRNKHGQESHREMRVRTLEMDGDGDRSLTIFDTPRDVKGTAFLSFSHKIGDDDQWLYLPALKRVKRISSHNKSGSFMGSEFAYEDIASQEIEKYTYKYLRDETCGDLDCFVVERYPVDTKNSGYTRMVSWMDKGEYRPWKVEYFDRKGSHLKTLLLSDYYQYLDTYWRAHTMVMENHQNGKTTHLYMRDFEFQTGLSEADFNKNALKRAK